MTSADTGAISANLAAISSRIQRACEKYAKANGLDSHSAELIAVTKYRDFNDILALHRLGVRAFGENKVQDLKAKMAQVNAVLGAGAASLDSRDFTDFTDSSARQTKSDSGAPHTKDTFGTSNTSRAAGAPIEWHFIGSLQRNKINALLALNPTLIHSIDSRELAAALNERCTRLGRIQRVLLQVNAANEASKHGFSLDSARDAFLQIRESAPFLELCGIMSIGANSDDMGLVEESFALTKALYDSLPNVSVLSMGMSGDFELAIKHGANMVRIGSALFE
ncbi:YggS family pyridoxal phosphate enzyme [Helicobacter sp. CLO-3]|uniref:YggS family pyridoxal phosphate-dependent enzyme n=1 Tax=unclassified Helicobacter TaxID=2593540 RepID=UPI00080593A8|nr:MULTISPECIES: YggS family pyridoxal phosphate-dependent enzyme [unclassified Helicobacter]OBV28380.1 YggS family pyridoxal phosphate enzyme [Helicobacter sp. CLO-3]OHU82035.1 YggS family pyridoxal phosphate enzyme [Helicobacter sp. CLO-3]